MGSFREDPRTWQELDFRLLQNGPVAMYFDPGILEEDAAWLSRRGYHLDRFDCSGWSTLEPAHAMLADVLRFPDYYGRNLDAFNDCLGDLEVHDPGRVLVFDRYDVAVDAIRPFANAVLDIIATVARY